jgi:hypothetical protein
MLRARYVDQNGQTIYLFGLDEVNVARLVGGEPLVFHGGQLGLATIVFMLVFVNTPEEVIPIHKNTKLKDPRNRLCCIGMTPQLLDLLTKQPLVIDGNTLKLDGHIKLVYAETQQMLAEALGYPDSSLPEDATEETILDPATGLLEKIKVPNGYVN